MRVIIFKVATMKFKIGFILFLPLICGSLTGKAQDFYGMLKVDSNLWMDQTEIRTNEYREFLLWTRDSIARKILTEKGHTEYGRLDTLPSGQICFVPSWETRIHYWDHDPDFFDGLFLENESIYINMPVINPKRINYRCAFGDSIVELNVFPDTSCWRMLKKPYNNESVFDEYFWHPMYDDYPMVGLTYDQMNAFCIWRSHLFNVWNTDSTNKKAKGYTVRFELPSKKQWEDIAYSNDSTDRYPGGIPKPKTVLLGPIPQKKSTNYKINSLESNFRIIQNPDKRKGKIVEGEWSWMVPVDQNNGYFGGSKKNKVYPFYGLAGNVAEVTIDGCLMGTSWYHPLINAEKGHNIIYNPNVPNAWTGFRCVVRLNKP